MTAPTRADRVLHLEAGAARWRADRLAIEEPLEIRIGGDPLMVTMRTPGDDFDLVAGVLLSEGVVEDIGEVTTMRACPAAPGGALGNAVDVGLRAGATTAAPPARRFLATSACGICGAESVAAVRRRLRVEVRDDPARFPHELLTRLPEVLRGSQRAFSRTGGLHAAGLFDAEGRLVCAREDIGRHNAFDKVIGWAARAGRLPLRSHLMLASGRASFELTQKALLAGVPALAAVSAPSTLAVELAEEAGMTLVGFLRGASMNVYAGEWRVAGAP